MDKLDDKYNPFSFEKEIYKFWLEKNYFHGEISPSKKPYSIVIPPPNITGYLHIGHALNNSLQDIIIRYARMKGYSACWIPGTDHAGIATQNVVEKELLKEGISRFDLGREKFVERVWQWKEKYGSRIIEQLKVLGCSCDWQRERFTFDENYCRAVTHEFVTLYNNGLIYRGNYIVNWCPRCLTAISDIEVEHRQKKASLWDIKYPVIDPGSGQPSSAEFITVSTSRPETMLGDTAVAVNPGDKRYGKYIGRKVLLPLAGRQIPVIADEYVDMKFGTGALKVTPAHDPNDFELGKKHNLEKINIMDDSAILNENAGKYKGLDRYQARKEILEDLKKMGLLADIRQHSSSVGTCSRCENIIEPRISNQWFVSMKELAGPAIEAVRSGKIKFVPKKWEKLYYNWMENIRDWCISRQLWWGHRIPVWYCRKCSKMIVSEAIPESCACGCNDLIQDSDVLDTWFSSCLWPFASQGWPGKTAELKYFFPTSLLITAHDIIFFWVARMIMMSLYFMKDVPFKEVFINPLVNDIYGQKMSKSRGNVIDPLSIIDRCGTDPLRFTLASLTTPGRNLLLGEEKIGGSRNFANKIWNASRFVIANLEKSGFSKPAGKTHPEFDGEPVRDIKSIKTRELVLNTWDRWILSRLSRTVKLLEKYISKYSISFACRTLVSFFWNDYCDWYLEASKVRLYKKQDPDKHGPDMEKLTSLYILWYVMEKYLRALHPFMPFLTEKIWQNIPHDGESIMVSGYPLNDSRNLDVIDDLSESLIGSLSEIIGEIRKVRTEQKINPSLKIRVNIDSANPEMLESLKENIEIVKSLAGIDVIEFYAPPDSSGFIKIAKNGVTIYICLQGLFDAVAGQERVLFEMEKINLEIDKSRKKLSNPQFRDKAPEQIIKKESLKLEKLQKEMDSLKEQLKLFRQLKI